MILDTNAVSALSEGNADVLARLSQAENPVLSFASLAEFQYGLLGSTKATQGFAFLEDLLKLVPVSFPDADAVMR